MGRGNLLLAEFHRIRSNKVLWYLRLFNLKAITLKNTISGIINRLNNHQKRSNLINVVRKFWIKFSNDCYAGVAKSSRFRWRTSAAAGYAKSGFIRIRAVGTDCSSGANHRPPPPIRGGTAFPVIAEYSYS